MRLFIAVTLPQKIRMLLHHMGNCLQGARAVPEEQIHITLRFLGDVEGGQFHVIRESLHEVQMDPFFLSLRGTGHFPPRGNPRVIWAGLNKTEQLPRLKKRVDRALLKCGIPPEGRKFSPHITLARCKTTSVRRAAEFLSGNALLHSEDFAVDAFHLFSSSLTPKGAIHTLEESYPLDTDLR